MSVIDAAEALARAGLTSRDKSASTTRRLVWSRDASHYRIMPSATHRAKDITEISRILALASRLGLPVTFRSGGSSLSGQTLGTGIVVDTRSSFQSLLEIAKDSVKAQPGVTLARLNGHLARRDRRIGPDPASMVASTLGGAVSNNSSGMTCGTEFNSYATIRSAKVVFADGEILDTSQDDADTVLRILKPDLYRFLSQTRDQIRGNRELSERVKGLFELKNTMGYSLNAFLDYEKPVEILLRLLVGSEGTLAFLGEIELATMPLLRLRSANLLIFDDLEAANKKVPKLLDLNPAAIELMDATSLRALAGEGMLPDQLASRNLEDSAAILVEFESDETSELEARNTALLKAFAKEAAITRAEGDLRNKLWAMRKGLYAVVAKARPAGTTALLEDVAVPPKNLATACKQLSDLCLAHGYGKPVIFGHVRDGNIHFMISDDFQSSERQEAFGRFTDEMVKIVLDLGGNLKAEHGTGRAMAPFVEAQFGPELFRIMQGIKKAFDPGTILNPGVILVSDQPEHLGNLKTTIEVSAIVDSCVECGYCESSCPSAGLTLTPRERIVAYRELKALNAPEQERVLRELHYQADQTCAVDGMCAVNCPVGINTGSFVKEIRAAKTGPVAEKISQVVERNWGKTTKLARSGLKIAQTVPFLARSITGIAASIAPKGTIPKWTKSVQSRGFARSKLSGSTSNFAFLPSCMNEVFGEPELSKFLEVANRAGVPIEIPEGIDNFCCGTPFASKGLVAAADASQRRTGLLLNSLEGKKIVIDGSSCHQTLLVDHPAAVEITQFILTELGDIKPKKRFERIVLHPTCSGEKTGGNQAMETIAHLIADEVIIPTGWRCCGYAGDRGLLVPELTANATAIETNEISNLDAVFVSNNQPCQVGMTSATNRRYKSILSAWLEAVT